MTFEEAVETIKGLLNRFPSVCVINWHRRHLVLYVGSRDSLIALCYCCRGGNVPFQVEPASSFRDLVAPPGHDELRYSMMLSDDLAWVEAFGWYLVITLFKRQLIDRAEAEALAIAWNCAIESLDED